MFSWSCTNSLVGNEPFFIICCRVCGVWGVDGMKPHLAREGGVTQKSKQNTPEATTVHPAQNLSIHKGGMIGIN